MPDPRRVRVEVDGRTLTLTNLDKVLFPRAGTTKAEVLTYLTAVAPALLRQLAGRPVTRLRFPHGTGADSFFEKNIPGGTPTWVPRVTLVSPHSRRADELVTYPLVEDVATLTWLGQLGSLELHTPQWRVDPDTLQDEVSRGLPSDRLVVDLDPGPPAGLHECAVVALAVKDVLEGAGLADCTPVTSGSKGLQVYATLPRLTPSEQTSAMAKTLADHLGEALPDLVVTTMTRSVRAGKVYVDWSQNAAAKTTITPYSLRGKKDSPFAAAPRTWDEIAEGADDPIALDQLTPRQVLDRLDSLGDLMPAADS